MDDYSLLNIFDYLNFEDWIGIAEVHPRIADVILHYYIIRKLHLNENPITISLEFRKPYFGYSSPSKNAHKLLNSENSTNTILSTLKLFGHAFNHITFAMPRFGNAIAQIFYDHFDKFCKNTTKTIIIQGVDYRALANWTYSFDETTTEIELRSSLDTPISFNTLFPYMKKLSVVKPLEADVQHYPYLTECSTKTFEGDDTNPSVHGLIRLNPQLTRFHTSTYPNSSYVEYVNEMLPNLEALTFRLTIHSRYISDQKIIRFKGVKEFTLDIYTKVPLPIYHHVIESIQFDQLKSFKLDVFEKVFADDKLIAMIATNKGLRKIETNVRMTHEVFNGLLQHLPELEEITIHWHHGMRETLRSFFIENHGLKRFKIDHNGFPMSIRDIQRHVPSNWLIVPNETPYRGYFSFIHKN